MASAIARYYLKHFVLSRQRPSVRNENCFWFLAMERLKKKMNQSKHQVGW